MAIGIVKFIKGLIATNGTDFDKQLKLTVTDSATTNTTTTLQSSQTADRVITLPDSSGTLITTGDEIARSSIAPGTPDRVVVNDGSGDLADSIITTDELETLGGISSNIQDQLDDKADSAAVTAALATKQDAATALTINGVQTTTNKTIGDAITLTEIATPSNPAAGLKKLYPKADGKLYTLNSAGVETEVGSGGGGGGADTDLSNLTPTAINESLIPDTNAALDLGTNLLSWGEAFIEELSLTSNGSTGSVKLVSPASSTNSVTYTIPDVDGTAGQVLSTDGSGELSWTDQPDVGAPIYGNYIKGGVQSLTTTAESVISYNVAFQSASYYNVGTNEITIPETGTYYFGYELVGAGTVQFNLNINVNGLLNGGARGYVAADGTVCLAKSFNILELNQNDIITVSAANISSTTRNVGGSIGSETSRFFFFKMAASASPSGGAVDSVNGQTGVVQIDAVDVPYDNVASGLGATDVQGAIDEIAPKVVGEQGLVNYYNTGFGANQSSYYLTLNTIPVRVLPIGPGGGPGVQKEYPMMSALSLVSTTITPGPTIGSPALYPAESTSETQYASVVYCESLASGTSYVEVSPSTVNSGNVPTEQVVTFINQSVFGGDVEFNWISKIRLGGGYTNVPKTIVVPPGDSVIFHVSTDSVNLISKSF